MFATVLSIGAILVALVGPAPAGERTRTFYDEKGQEIGRTTTRGNTTTFFNNRGQEVGRAERRGNTTNFYNDKGQMIGASRGPAR
jgi:YD repeat-containing protein